MCKTKTCVLITTYKIAEFENFNKIYLGTKGRRLIAEEWKHETDCTVKFKIMQ